MFFAVSPGGSFHNFYCHYSAFLPGFPHSDLEFLNTPNELIETFKAWIENEAKAYIDDASVPDLWQILEDTRTHQTSEAGTQADFAAFSEEEKRQVRLSINEFRLLIVNNFGPSKEALELVNARLKYLSDAVDKHNKFVWKGIAIQTVLSIIITLSLSPEQGSKLFQLFKDVFSHLIYLLPSG